MKISTQHYVANKRNILQLRRLEEEIPNLKGKKTGKGYGNVSRTLMAS